MPRLEYDPDQNSYFILWEAGEVVRRVINPETRVAIEYDREGVVCSIEIFLGTEEIFAMIEDEEWKP